MTSTALTRAALCVLGPALLATTASAQVPPGSAVVGTYHDPAATKRTGDPGLYLVSVPGGKVTKVTGLPFQFTAKVPQFPNGCWTAAVRQTDGAIAATALFVGDVNLWVFHLNGSAVDQKRSKTVLLGKTGPTSLGIAYVTPLPDGRFYVTAVQQSSTGKISTLSSGPMKDSSAAIVDTSGSVPKVTPLPPRTGDQGEAQSGGVRADPTGRYIYRVATSSLSPKLPTTSSLARLDLKTNVWCRIATFKDEHIPGFAVNEDGSVYLSAWKMTAKELEYRIHKVTPEACGKAQITTTKMPGILGAWSVALDRRSGQLVLGSIDCGAFPFCNKAFDNSIALADPKTGKLTKLTNGPAGGWQGISADAVSMRNVIENYGERTDSANAYWFDNFPNPGGQPVIGNAKFSLTVHSAPGAPKASALILSGGMARFDLMGMAIHLDPATAFALGLVAAKSASVPLPIPNSRDLQGLELFAQSIHMDSKGFGTSHGLRFKVQ